MIHRLYRAKEEKTSQRQKHILYVNIYIITLGDRLMRIFLKKVIGYGTLGGRWTLILWRRFEYRKASIEMFIKFQNSSNITTTITIIRGGPDSEHRFIEMPLIAFHHELMGPADQIDVIHLIELRDHIAAEEVASTAWTDSPAKRFLWIRPKAHLVTTTSTSLSLPLTREDHTSVHRAVLPSSDRSVWFDRACSPMGSVHHAHRRFSRRSPPIDWDSRTLLCSIARPWSIRISSNIRRRSRRLGWFDATRGFPGSEWFDRDIALSGQGVRETSRRCKNRDQRNHRGTSSWFVEHRLEQRRQTYSALANGSISRQTLYQHNQVEFALQSCPVRSISSDACQFKSMIDEKESFTSSMRVLSVIHRRWQVIYLNRRWKTSPAGWKSILYWLNQHAFPFREEHVGRETTVVPEMFTSDPE